MATTMAVDPVGQPSVAHGPGYPVLYNPYHEYRREGQARGSRGEQRRKREGRKGEKGGEARGGKRGGETHVTCQTGAKATASWVSLLGATCDAEHQPPRREERKGKDGNGNKINEKKSKGTKRT